MKDFVNTGVLAVSLAGHDRGQLYLITEEDDIWCLLVNGRNRTAANPKRKKKKHLQRIIHLPDSIKDRLENVETDAQIRAVLKEYSVQSNNPVIHRQQ